MIKVFKKISPKKYRESWKFNPRIFEFSNFLIFKLLSFCLIFNISCKEKTLFTLLPSSETGITFANNIIENDTLNILSFEYLYNGGGVAMGDFNNDNLTDIYFTGNTVENKLYLNKGDFKFEDITNQSLPKKEKERWSSGVALVDINNDKLLDIYVCATHRTKASLRANQLFVNQGVSKNGIPKFREMAAEYGIADTTHTTNAAFFDYDNDGDLDLYLLVNQMSDSRLVNKYHDKITDGSSVRTHRLYRNETVRSKEKGENITQHSELSTQNFIDVSKEAGILHEGFGLGLNICDINQDGWKDIYVTNDFLTTDFMYINNQDGTFTEKSSEYFKHTSQSAMGNDVADINNDGLPDIIAVDMMPKSNDRKKTMMPPNNYNFYQKNDEFNYQYQYPRNTLQLNLGKNPEKNQPIFSEIGLLLGVAETDWSWTPSVVDFDNDGLRDIFITNGFPKDITDQDFIAYRNEFSTYISKLDLRDSIPAVKLPNYAFRNLGNLQFGDVTKLWGLNQPSFSNGAAYADLDNDGDLDYVVNNINGEAMIYRNNLREMKPEESNFLRIKFEGETPNKMGLGAIIEVFYDNKYQFYEHTTYRGYLSTIEPIAHFGVGKAKKIDKIIVKWQSGKKQIIRNVKFNQTIILKEIESKINFENIENNINIDNKIFSEISEKLEIKYSHQENDFIDFNIQKLLLRKYSQDTPKLAVGDIDKNGLDDVFVCGSAGFQGNFLLQQPNGKFVQKPFVADPADKPFEDSGCVFFDAEGDNDLDLVVASGSYEQARKTIFPTRFYINDGKGNFKRDSISFPRLQISASCIRASDYDKDGDLDLFVGGRVSPANYPSPVSSFILTNQSKNGKISFKTTELKNIGMVSDAIWSDFDKDGWDDLVLTGDFMPITFFANKKKANGERIFIINEKISSINTKKGFWQCIKSGDLDKDGDTDYVVGNLGLNNVLRANAEKPVRVYAKDFDNDGFFDAIPTVYFSDLKGNFKEFPLHSRDDLFKQIISMRKKFTNYKSYSVSTIDKVLSQEELAGALILEANYLNTSILLNDGKGNFEVKSLPIEAQFAPVNDLLVDDFDGDKNLDILMIGNDYGNEVSVGKYDAFNGLMLKGDGKGNFKTSLPSANGFCVEGDAKSLVKVKTSQNKNLIFASQNRGKLRVFSIK